MELLSKKEDFGIRKMSANVPVCVNPASFSYGPRVKDKVPSHHQRLCIGSQQLHTRQLHCLRSPSAILYCYLLIGGAGSHFIEDEEDVFYLTLAH